MTQLQSPAFPPHGSSRFERRGQLLLLHSQGPFNAEHIQSLVSGFRLHAAELKPCGPWASINIVSGSIMATPEAIEALRRSALWAYQELGRVAIAYVVATEVEGRGLMTPPIQASGQGVVPVGLFPDYAAAEAWALQRLAEYTGGA